jgi:hypothetical protein
MHTCTRDAPFKSQVIGSPRPCISLTESDVWLQKGAAPCKTRLDKAGNRSGSEDARLQRNRSKREDKMTGTSRDVMQVRSTRPASRLLGELELSPGPDYWYGSWRHGRTVVPFILLRTSTPLYVQTTRDTNDLERNYVRLTIWFQ